MALELRRRGRRVALAAPGRVTEPALGEAGVLIFDGARVTRVPANGSVAPITLSVRSAVRLRSWAAAHGPFVAHLHEPATPVLGWSLLRRHRGGLVATVHRSGSDRLYRVAGPVLSRLVARVDVVVAVSEAAATTAHETMGLDADVLFNGIDVASLSSAEPWPATAKTVLFVGRDEPRKGRPVLVEAARSLPEDVTIWLTGEPGASRAGPGARLEWLGVISEEEKRRRLRAADVLCAPALGGESFGMVLLEGLAAGCAVVASDIDGYRQALGGHGTLVPASDPDALCQAIRSALSAPRDPAPGLAHAERWSIGALMDAYEDRYELARSGQPGSRQR
jgi:phosphatidylinositol alpha-mannosyltransferase